MVAAVKLVTTSCTEDTRFSTPWAGSQRPGQVHNALGRFTTPWAGSQRPGQVHSALGRFTTPWAGSQRPGQVHNALGRFATPWAGSGTWSPVIAGDQHASILLNNNARYMQHLTTEATRYINTTATSVHQHTHQATHHDTNTVCNFSSNQ